MRQFGTLDPFIWKTSVHDIDTENVYLFPSFTFVVNKTVTAAKRVRLDTGAETNMTLNTYSWDINGQTQVASKLSTTTSEGIKYYLKITIGSTTYYSGVIEGIGSDCAEILSITNSCNNFNFPFADAPSTIDLKFPNVQINVSETENTYETIITENGTKEKLIKQITRYKLWFVLPKWYGNMLAGARSTDGNYNDIGGINKIDFTRTDIAGSNMAEFELTIEYSTIQEGNDCCDDVDLDDILNPGGGGSGSPCEGYSIAIDNTDDTLSVDLTDPPIGTPSYRWYRNGTLISSASTIDILQPGDYRVDVTIDGCRATASYYKDNVCGLFDVRVYSSGNFVNADISNTPEDCSEEISVILDGVEVATSLPYEVEETGTYFVKVTACSCVKSGAVYVVFSEETTCEFTVDIDVDGATLTADTDASSPSYLWEFEDGSGRTTVGTGDEITAINKGLYWLTVTDGGCSKETYVYLPPSSQTGVVVLYKSNGYQFDVIGLNLLEFSAPANELLVTINGVVYTYTSDTTPDSANLYSINSSGQLVTRSSTPFTNATIIIKVL